MFTGHPSDFSENADNYALINWAISVPLYLDDSYTYSQLCKKVTKSVNRKRIKRKQVIVKDTKKIERYVVNKIRHELTNYDEVVDGIAKIHLQDIHFAILHYRILALIGSTYTELGSECARQQKMKLKNRRINFNVQDEIDRRNTQMAS